MSKILDVLRHDAWVSCEGDLEPGAFFMRWRTPVIESKDVGDHIHRLSVVWPYAEIGSGEMLDEEISDQMEVFENRLLEAWEHDGNAFLAAVLTFDGARQWIFYTKNVDECGERIENMPQEEEPYPIELTTEEDSGWSYLHEQILAIVDWRKHQGDWEKALKESLVQ